MEEKTKSTTPSAVTGPPSLETKPDVNYAADKLLSEKRLNILVELLMNNDEEWKSSGVRKPHRRSGKRTREKQRTVLGTLPEQQELLKSQEGLNVPPTDSSPPSSLPLPLNVTQSSQHDEVPQDKHQDECQKQRSLSLPEVPNSLDSISSNISSSSPLLSTSPLLPPTPLFPTRSRPSEQTNSQSSQTSTRQSQSTSRRTFQKRGDSSTLFSKPQSLVSSSVEENRLDIDTPPVAFEILKLRRTLPDFLEFLFNDKEMDIVLSLCDFADKNIIYADGMAMSLICIFSSFGRHLDLIRTAITREIQHCDMATTLLRRNSIAVKIISLFVKRVGGNYLRRVLAPFCHQIALAKNEQLEVDPVVLSELVPDDKVEQIRIRNMDSLRKRCEQIVEAIMNSLCYCPGSFRFICSELKRIVQQKFRGDIWRQAVAGFLFLRFFCSALVTPENYGLLTPPISSEVRRKLVLVAKVVQNLASGSTFTGKENFLVEMNSFVTQYSPVIRAFYEKIASIPTLIPVTVQPKITKVDLIKALLELQCFVSLRKAKIIKTVEESQKSDDELLRIVNKIETLTVLLDQHNFLGEIIQLDPTFSFSDIAASPRRPLPNDSRDLVQPIDKPLKREYRLPHPDDIWVLNIWNDETFEVKTKLDDLNDKKKSRGRVANEFVISLIEKLLELERKFKKSGNGFINCNAVQQDPVFVEFQNMSAQLQKLELKSLSHVEKKVLFINIYNLLMMHIHLIIGPPINKFRRNIYFKSFCYNIDKHNYTLDDIKNGILRGNPRNSNDGKRHFNKKDPRRSNVLPLDPRIHFCLTTFSKDSPRFRLFFTEQVDKQLDEAAQEYCDNFVSVNPHLKKVTLPKVFQWYSEDFHIVLPTPPPLLSISRTNALKRRSTSSVGSEHSRTSSDSGSDSNHSVNNNSTAMNLNSSPDITEPMVNGNIQEREENVSRSSKDNLQFLKLLKQFIIDPRKIEDLQQLCEQKDLRLTFHFTDFDWEPTYWTSNWVHPTIPKQSSVKMTPRLLLTVSQDNLLEGNIIPMN